MPPSAGGVISCDHQVEGSAAGRTDHISFTSWGRALALEVVMDTGVLASALLRPRTRGGAEMHPGWLGL